MNNTQHVDTLEGFSIGMVVGAHLEPTIDRDISTGDPRLSNPFEDFDQVYPMPPPRVYVVTDAMRAADAAARATREAIPETSWTAFKRTLGEHNLQVTRRPATPLRQATSTIPPKPRVSRITRHCSSCGKGLSRNTKGHRCLDCYNAEVIAPTKKTIDICTGCQKKLGVNNTSGNCNACAHRPGRPRAQQLKEALQA